MEHDYVIEQNVASRYLSDRLVADERAAFEEHFIDCAACLEALESADQLQLGLKAVAARDALTKTPPNQGSWRSRRTIAAAAALAAAIVVAVGTADVIRTRRELTQASTVAIDLARQSERAQSLIRSLSDRVRQLESAPPAAAMAPTAGQSSAPVFALTMPRGGGASGPANRVTLSGASDWIVLSLELDDPDVTGRYRATLRDAQQLERWRDDALIASTPDTLAIALRSALLVAGDYSLDVDRQPPHSTAWIPAGRYAFRVVQRR